MRAVVLAGGLGTRLRPFTTILPKPLIPVGDRPIIDVILHQLAAAGVRTVDLCVGHLGGLIRAYFAEAANLPDGLELAWHWEDEPLGTAGALRGVPGLTETSLVMNGDILTTLDYRELVAFHRREGAALTVAMHTRRTAVEGGVIEHRDGRLTGYREKPSLEYDLSMGVYIYEPRALSYLPPGPSAFPDLVLRLVHAGEPVAAFRSDAEWYDIGTVSEYERAVRSVQARPELFSLPAARRVSRSGSGNGGEPPSSASAPTSGSDGDETAVRAYEQRQ